jgi:hypothetical protein
VVGGEFDPGQFVDVRCVDFRGYDLIARPVEMGLPVLK